MTAAGWRPLPTEGLALYSPIGLRLIDDFTGGSPLGGVSAQLDRQVSLGVWEPTEVEAVLTQSSVFIWPRLGRTFEPATAPTLRYRVRIEAERYRPEYLQSVDGFEFDAPPWNDLNPPQPISMGPQDLYLLPELSYGFPTWVPVLRGRVEDAAGAPVVNVLVHQAIAERTLTDPRGCFAIPLRWATNGLSLDAVDVRTGRTGTHVLNLPADLRTNVTITIV